MMLWETRLPFWTGAGALNFVDFKALSDVREHPTDP
jgi:hypothetical protein